MSLYYTKNAAARAKLREQLIESESKRPGAQKITAKNAPVVAVIAPYGSNDGVSMTIWTRTAAKPASNYLYASRERAVKVLNECIKREAERKKPSRKAAKAADHWTVGDVVYTSWGYDQTNVEYYQITELKPKSVKVRQIAANCSDYGGPSGGKTAPRRFEFVGPEIFCPLDPYGNFSAGPCYNSDKPSFRHQCSKWDGAAKYTSSNH